MIYRIILTVLSISTFGWLLLYAAAFGRWFEEEAPVPSDPYQAVNSIEFEEIDWYLRDYQREVEPDTLDGILRRVFRESRRLKTFLGGTWFCVREGKSEFRAAIVERLEHFKSLPPDSSWLTFNGQHYEQNGATDYRLTHATIVLKEAGWIK